MRMPSFGADFDSGFRNLGLGVGIGVREKGVGSRV